MTACLLSKVYFVPTELLLVDPVVLSLLPAVDLLLLEPQVNLLLGGLDSIGAVADIAADILVSRSVSTITIERRAAARTMAKSPRMVPGDEASGLVAPRSWRPTLTASRPSQTIAQTGPLPMSILLSVPCSMMYASCSCTYR
jgi:hypothetical protein